MRFPKLWASRLRPWDATFALARHGCIGSWPGTPPRVTPDQWRHVEEIFLAALEKDGDTRSQYLDEVCRGKADLRAQVESLLAHAGGGTGTLESLVSEAATKLPASRDKYIDSNIGPYRILHRLDEG